MSNLNDNDEEYTISEAMTMGGSFQGNSIEDLTDSERDYQGLDPEPDPEPESQQSDGIEKAQNDVLRALTRFVDPDEALMRLQLIHKQYVSERDIARGDQLAENRAEALMRERIIGWYVDSKDKTLRFTKIGLEKTKSLSDVTRNGVDDWIKNVTQSKGRIAFVGDSESFLASKPFDLADDIEAMLYANN